LTGERSSSSTARGLKVGGYKMTTDNLLGRMGRNFGNHYCCTAAAVDAIDAIAAEGRRLQG